MTTISNIKTSRTVTLPGWCGEPDEGFECELRRPSLMALASKGAIPNPLMKTARRIFYSGISAADGNFKEEAEVLTAVAKAALVKPSLSELEEQGVELTDEQLIAIFQFTQLGAKALERFRQLPANPDGDIRGAEVSE